MPPDFTVRPPNPGAPRPQSMPEQQQAEQALVPQTALTGYRPVRPVPARQRWCKRLVQRRRKTSEPR